MFYLKKAKQTLLRRFRRYFQNSEITLEFLVASHHFHREVQGVSQPACFPQIFYGRFLGDVYFMFPQCILAHDHIFFLEQVQPGRRKTIFCCRYWYCVSHQPLGKSFHSFLSVPSLLCPEMVTTSDSVVRRNTSALCFDLFALSHIFSLVSAHLKLMKLDSSNENWPESLWSLWELWSL